MEPLLLIVVAAIIAVWLFKSFPGLTVIAFFLFAMYAIELGSHEKIPLMTNFMKGVNIMFNSKF
jgi:hypothetical protein